jgi:hypothetical protein
MSAAQINKVGTGRRDIRVLQMIDMQIDKFGKYDRLLRRLATQPEPFAPSDWDGREPIAATVATEKNFSFLYANLLT